eukprot:CAMPEP_0181105300 /NCGR_PEP_ID=MMETSP1071-20121207/15912_1 /TAXON_ID=35127 /ORGANISM="Thalassiosira sp., Strain NH16" /LENGTH=112 /DNA_ID=CAMNT_0023188605 /DNA_START=34 /DNA_END=373 /DNA_ORIENTATION=-
MTEGTNRGKQNDDHGATRSSRASGGARKYPSPMRMQTNRPSFPGCARLRNRCPHRRCCHLDCSRSCPWVSLRSIDSSHLDVVRLAALKARPPSSLRSTASTSSSAASSQQCL